MMAADTMEALGIKRGDYVIKVNNRKVLDGVMEAIGLGGEDKAGKRLTVLRAIDKLDRLGPEGVRQLLGTGRKDESGDFTKGAGLEPMPSSACSPSRRFSTGPKRHTVESLRRVVGLNVSSARGEGRRGRTRGDRGSGRGLRLRGPRHHRPLRRPRPRILHRPGLRGRADLPVEGRGRASRALRLRRRAAGAMTASSGASAASPCRRPASPSACRGCCRRCRS